MSVGAVKPFAVTMATQTTLTSAFDLGGAYGQIMIGIPTMTSGTNHYLQVSDSPTGTFRRLYHGSTVATAKPTVWVVDSSVTNCYLPVVCHAQYGKIELSTMASDTSHTYKVICSTN